MVPFMYSESLAARYPETVYPPEVQERILDFVIALGDLTPEKAQHFRDTRVYVDPRKVAAALLDDGRVFELDQLDRVQEIDLRPVPGVRFVNCGLTDEEQQRIEKVLEDGGDAGAVLAEVAAESAGERGWFLLRKRDVAEVNAAWRDRFWGDDPPGFE